MTELELILRKFRLSIHELYTETIIDLSNCIELANKHDLLLNQTMEEIDNYYKREILT